MIPKEIDDLMWTIAEGTNQQAIEEFGDRYPNLREELLKRIKTINALKAGGRTAKVANVPVFENPVTAPINLKPLFVSFGVAVLAISTFGVWRVMNPPASAQTAPVQVIDVNTPKQPEANLPTYPANNIPENPKQDLPVNPPQVPTTDPNAGIIAANGKKTVQLESATLKAAILLIAESGHYMVNFAPGMHDPMVKVDFQDMTPMEMLKELGEEYGFVALPDGKHDVLIIPKKDEEDDRNQFSNETR